jgi:hypothetical protein
MARNMCHSGDICTFSVAAILWTALLVASSIGMGMTILVTLPEKAQRDCEGHPILCSLGIGALFWSVVAFLIFGCVVLVTKRQRRNNNYVTLNV